MKYIKAILMVALLLLCVVAPVLAQTNTPPDITSTDEGIRQALERFSWLKIFIVPITTVVVMGARLAIKAIPIQLWPWITPFLGAGLDYLGAKFGFWTTNPAAGAAMGGLAVWFHQLGAQTLNIAEEGPKPSAGGSN